MNLAGKVYVITGGSRGIGAAIARTLARHGAHVALLAKTAKPHPKLPGTVFSTAIDINNDERVRQAGGEAWPYVVDIRDDTKVHEAI